MRECYSARMLSTIYKDNTARPKELGQTKLITSIQSATFKGLITAITLILLASYKRRSQALGFLMLIINIYI